MQCAVPCVHPECAVVRRIARAPDVDSLPTSPSVFSAELCSARVKPIAHTHNVAQPEMFHVHLISRGLFCVGSILVQNELIRNAVPGVARCILRVYVVHSMRPQMGWGREPDEHWTRDPQQCSLFRHSEWCDDFGFKMNRSTTDSTCFVPF